MRIEAAGYGAGERDNDVPNVVRVLVGAESEHVHRSAVMIETNVDDMNPELLPHVIERLLDAGAQDAWITPIIMKKGRPALTLGALIDPRDRDAAAEIIFRETSTLGVRVSVVDKYMLERDSITTEVAGIDVRVKVGKRGREIVTLAPEFEDALSVAHTTGMPLRRVYELAVEAARNRAAPACPTRARPSPRSEVLRLARWRPGIRPWRQPPPARRWPGRCPPPHPSPRARCA
jgi:uncharacterized protein (DUF111 family)